MARGPNRASDGFDPRQNTIFRLVWSKDVVTTRSITNSRIEWCAYDRNVESLLGMREAADVR